MDKDVAVSTAARESFFSQMEVGWRCTQHQDLNHDLGTAGCPWDLGKLQLLSVVCTWLCALKGSSQSVKIHSVQLLNSLQWPFPDLAAELPS